VDRLWSWGTFLLYIFIAVYFFLTMKKVVAYSGRPLCNIKQKRKKTMYILLCILFPVIIATFRQVGQNIGGTDAWGYVKDFNRIQDFSFDLIGYFRFEADINPLFSATLYLFKLICNDYHLVFFFIYSFICYSMYAFVREFYQKGMYMLPLIYVVMHYLQSFNIIKFMYGMAFILLSFTYIKKDKKVLGLIFAFLGALVHASLLVVLFMEVAYYIYFRVLRLKKRFFLIFGIIVIYAGLLACMSYLRGIFSDGVYRTYVSWDSTIFSSLTTIICALMAIFTYKDISKRAEFSEFAVYCTLFNFACLPLINELGFYRLHIIFLFPRLYTWSLSVCSIDKKLKARGIVKLAFGCIFISYLVFRFMRDYESAGFMPYRFDF